MSGASARGSMRARDMDRVQARTVLDAAYDEGQLTAEEYHHRSDRAAAAKTVGELRRLVGDLQPPAGGAQWRQPAAPPPRSGRYPARIRARAADRAETCRALDAALADGQLSEDEHAALTELTADAKTLGELGDLTEDLQRPADTPADPRARTSPKTAAFAGVVVALAVGAAVGGYLLTHHSAPPAPPVAAAAPAAAQPLVFATPDLTTIAGFEKFRGDYHAKFGDTTVDELSLFPGYADLDRTSAAQPNRAAGYEYQGGFMLRSKPTSRTADKPLFDLASVNSARLRDLIAQAVALSKVDGGTIGHIEMEIDGITDQPTISIYVGNPFHESGYLEATPAGDLIRVYPFDR